MRNIIISMIVSDLVERWQHLDVAVVINEFPTPANSSVRSKLRS